jgi:hypothetical protein
VATIPAKMMMEIPFPKPSWVISLRHPDCRHRASSHRGNDREGQQPFGTKARDDRNATQQVEDVDLGDRLQHCHRNRQIVGVALDFLLSAWFTLNCSLGRGWQAQAIGK